MFHQARVFSLESNSNHFLSTLSLLRANMKWQVHRLLPSWISTVFKSSLKSPSQSHNTEKNTEEEFFWRQHQGLISSHPSLPQKPTGTPSSWQLCLHCNFKSGSTVERNCLTHFFSNLLKITAWLTLHFFITENWRMWEFNTQGVTINLILSWS